MIKVFKKPGKSGNTIATVLISNNYYNYWKKYVFSNWKKYCEKYNLGLITINDFIDKSQVWTQWSSDLLMDGAELVEHGKCKRKELNVELQGAISSQAMSSGRAVSTGRFLKAHPDLYDDRHADTLNKRHLVRYMNNTKEAFQDNEWFSMASDGVRSGNPAVENVVAVGCNPKNLTAAWFPPMDRFF